MISYSRVPCRTASRVLAPRKAQPTKPLLNGKGAVGDSDFAQILLPQDAQLASYFEVGCTSLLCYLQM